MSTPEVVDTGGAVYDDPNRESVGLEPAWVEGTGGEPGDLHTAEPADDGSSGETLAAADGLDQMTKADLLAKAQEMGVTPANNDMTKAELVAAIRQAGG
jgi:hypothetical protein